MSSNARYHDDEAGKVLLGLIDIFYNVIIGRGGATYVCRSKRTESASCGRAPPNHNNSKLIGEIIRKCG